LTGTEIKSLRARNAGITDAYVYVKNGEAFIANMHIAAYKEGNIFNVDHLRDRKLAIDQNRIRRLAQ
jgi:SsrA-binding protein